MVAMNRMIGSWFTRCFSTRRSISSAISTITPTVSGIDRIAGRVKPKSWMLVPSAALIRCENGTCPVWMPTSVNAANSAITPWAKLKMPEALKISTKPSATSEYMMPTVSPLSAASSAKRTVSDMPDAPQNDVVEISHAPPPDRRR